MITDIEEKIVSLGFDKEDFEVHVQEALATLDKLNKALKLEEGVKGLENISEAAQRVNLSGVSDSVERIKVSFRSLQTIGVTALANLTNSATNMLKNIAMFVPRQITQGGLTRALNIEQARFQIKGLKKDWDALYEDMEYAVNDTAYGIDEAAVAAAQMSASGIKAGEDMKAALRGISGVAAMTNQSYSSVADVFTTVAANGTASLQDINRLAARGLNARAPIVQFVNGVHKGSIEATEDVKKSVDAIIAKYGQGGKITQATIKDLTADKDVKLLTSGIFTRAMDHAFGANATKANNTYAGSLANLKAAFSRIGADFQAKKLENLRKIFNTLRVVVDNVRKALYPLINAWNRWSTSFVKHSILPYLKRINSAIKSTEVWKTGKKLMDAASKASKSTKKASDNIKKHANDISKNVQGVGKVFKVTQKEAEAAWDIWNKGKYGNGEARKRNLAKAGLEYKNVQAYVNALIAADFDLSKVNIKVEKSTKRSGKASADAAKNHKKNAEELANIKEKALPFEQALKNIIGVIKILKNVVEGVFAILKPSLKVIGAEAVYLIDLITTKATPIIQKLFGNSESFLAKAPTYGEKLAAVVGKIVNLFNNLLNLPIFTHAVRIIISLKNILTGLFRFLAPILKSIGHEIFVIIGSITDLVGSLSGDALPITEKLQELTEKFMNKAPSVGTKIASILTKVFGIFNKIFSVISKIIKFGGKVITTIVTKVVSIATKIKDIVKSNTALLRFFDALKALGSTLYSALTKVFDTIKEGFERFKDTGGLEKIKSFSKDILDILLDISQKGLEKITGFVEKLANIKSFNFVDSITAFFKTIKDGAGGIFEKIAKGENPLLAIFDIDSKSIKEKFSNFSLKGLPEFGKGIKSLVKDSGMEFKALDDMLDDSGSTVDKFKNLIDNFKEAILNMDFKKLLDNTWTGTKIVAVLGTLGPTRKLLSSFSEGTKTVLKELKDSVKAWSAIPESITNVTSALSNVSKSLDGIQETMKTKVKIDAIKTFSISILALTASLYLLSTIDTENLLVTAVTLVSIMAVLVLIFRQIAKLQAIDVTAMTKVAAGFAALGASLLALSIAMKILATMSGGDITKGLLTISLIMGMFTLVARFAKDVYITSGIFVSMAMAILILVPAITLLSAMKPETVAKSTAMISGLLIMMALASRLMGRGAKGALALMAMAVAIDAMIPALIAMALIPKKQLIKAASVLSAVLISIAVAARIASGTIGSVAALSVMAAIIVEVVAALVILAFVPMDKLIKAAVSLTSVLVSIALAGQIASKSGKSVVAISIVLGLLIAMFRLLAEVDEDVMLKQATAMASIVLAIGVSFAILEKTQTTIKGALKSVGIILIGLAALTGVVYALGYLSDEAKDKIDRGGKVLGSIGEAIGNFIGGIRAGIASRLPEIGESISKFSKSLKPMLDMLADARGEDILKSVKDLTEAFLYITGARLFDSIASWITGSDSFREFGKQLVGFVPILKDFIDALHNDIKLDNEDLNKINLIAKALKTFAKAADEIPNQGGLLALIVGDNKLKDFGNQIENFVFRINQAADSASTIDEDGLYNLPRIAKAAKAIANMAKEIPNTGGMIAAVVGDNNLIAKVSQDTSMGFGAQIEGFVTHFNEAADSAAKVNDAGITNLPRIAKAAKAMANMAKEIPNSGGMISAIVGDNRIFKSFKNREGKSIKEGFGVEIKGFVEVFNETVDAAAYLDKDGVAVGKVESIAKAAMAFANLAKKLPKTGGALQNWTGWKDLGKFADDVATFAGTLDAFKEYIRGEDALTTDEINKIRDIGAAATEFAKVAEALPKEGEGISNNTYNFKSFGSKIVDLITALKDIAPELAGVETTEIEKLQDVAKVAKTLAEVYKTLNDAGLFDPAEEGTGSMDSNSKISAVSSALGEMLTSVNPILRDLKDIDVDEVYKLNRVGEAISQFSDSLAKISEKDIKEERMDMFMKYISGDENSIAKKIRGFLTELEGVDTENLQGLADAANTIGDFIANIGDREILTKNVESMKDALPGLGEAVAGFVGDINGLTTEELDAKVQAIKNAIDSLKNVSLEGAGLDGLSDSIINSLAESIRGGGSSLATALSTAISNSVANVPTKPYKTAGMTLIDALSEKISDSGDTIAKAAETASKEGSNGADSESAVASWKSAGKNAAKGFVDGLDEYSWYQAAYNKALEAIKGAKDALDTNSPSKEFIKIGKSVNEGLIVGITQYSNRVYRASYDNASQSIEGANKALEGLHSPVITPVLDLTQLLSQADGIRTLLNNQNGVGLATAINANIDNTDPNLALQESIDRLTTRIDDMERNLIDNQVDPNRIYDAVRTGASDSTLSVTLNHRELSRQVSRMGGSK